MNKKILSIFTGIFLFLVCVSFISAQQTVTYPYNYDSNTIQIASLKYDPYPVNPGEYFDIWIQAQLGDNDYVKFELIEEYPFSLDENEEAVREYENIGNREVVMHYKVRVDEDAVEGVNELKLKYSSGAYSSEGVIKIFEVHVSDVQTKFEAVVQEMRGSEVSIAIANIGKNTANSVIVRVPDQENYKAVSISEQLVGNLDSGDFTVVGFNIAPKNADGGKLKIQIDYTDIIGERRSEIKEVVFDSSLITGTNFQNGNPESTANGSGSSSSGLTNWLIWVLIAVIIVILFFKRKKIIGAINKHKHKSKGKESSSEEIPDWVKKEKSKG